MNLGTSVSIVTISKVGITVVKVLRNCRFDAIVGSMTNLNQLIADFESRNHHYGNPQNQATEMTGVARVRDKGQIPWPFSATVRSQEARHGTLPAADSVALMTDHGACCERPPG